MKRTLFLVSLSLFVCFATFAQNALNVGDMKVAAFNAMNAKGAAMVKAIKPTKSPLSESDNELLMQVAMGGKKQLAISQAVLNKTTNAQVKVLAKSEVEEQTTLAAKLKQVAMAKGLTLPIGVDAAAEELIQQANALSGTELDAFYISQSGIKGHQELEATMTTVKETAKDAALKALATATLPVIRLHLEVSQQVQTAMGGTSGN